MPDPRDPLQIVGANNFDRGMWLGQQHERMKYDKYKAIAYAIAALISGYLAYNEIRVPYTGIVCVCTMLLAMIYFSSSKKYELICELKKNPSEVP